MITVEAIPYKGFKERLKITKELDKTEKPYFIEIFSSFIYIQKGDFRDEL